MAALWKRSKKASLERRSSWWGVDVKLFGRQLWVTNVKLRNYSGLGAFRSKLPDQDKRSHKYQRKQQCQLCYFRRRIISLHLLDKFQQMCMYVSPSNVCLEFGVTENSSIKSCWQIYGLTLETQGRAGFSCSRLVPVICRQGMVSHRWFLPRLCSSL